MTVPIDPAKDQWFAIYRESDGELVSTGTIIPFKLASGLVAKPIDPPDFGDQQWDATQKLVVAKPPPPPPRDRIAAYEADKDPLTEHEKLLKYFDDVRFA